MRCMAPSTPPPPRRDSLAAMTLASVASPVMSPRTTSIRIVAGWHAAGDIPPRAQSRRRGRGPVKTRRLSPSRPPYVESRIAVPTPDKDGRPTRYRRWCAEED